MSEQRPLVNYAEIHLFWPVFADARDWIIANWGLVPSRTGDRIDVTRVDGSPATGIKVATHVTELVDAQGNPIGEVITIRLDKDGQSILDAKAELDGTLLITHRTDEWVPVLDENDNPVLDENDNPVYEEPPEPTYLQISIDIDTNPVVVDRPLPRISR